MGADAVPARHIEIDRDGRRWTGTYRVSGNEIEVHSAYGTRKTVAHHMPTSSEQQDYLDGLARLLLVEIVDRHLGIR
jgi:hypothetical protein